MVKHLESKVLNLKTKSDWLILLLVISIFTKELFTRMIGGIQVDFFGYTFFTLYFLLQLKDIKIAPSFLFFFILIIFSSTVTNIYLQLDLFPLIKQVIPVTIIFLASFDILFRYRNRLEEVIHIYITIAFYAAVFGIIQYFLSVAGINILIKIPGHLDSIAYEGSHYAAFATPATVLSFYFFRTHKLKALVLLLSLVLTFSSTSFIIILIVFLIPRLNPVYAIFLVPLTYYIFINYILNIHENFMVRYEAMRNYLKTGDYGVNGTIVSMASNLEVAISSLQQGNLLGVGLGGHESMYQRHYAGTEFEKGWFYELNMRSAHSLTIRVFSELGIIGLLAFVYLLVKKYIPKRSDLFHHAVSLACISHFLCKTLKLGGYIDYGTPFFFCLLLVNYTAYREKKRVSKKIIINPITL